MGEPPTLQRSGGSHGCGDAKGTRNPTADTQPCPGDRDRRPEHAVLHISVPYLQNPFESDQAALVPWEFTPAGALSPGCRGLIDEFGGNSIESTVACVGDGHMDGTNDISESP